MGIDCRQSADFILNGLQGHETQRHNVFTALVALLDQEYWLLLLGIASDQIYFVLNRCHKDDLWLTLLHNDLKVMRVIFIPQQQTLSQMSLFS